MVKEVRDFIEKAQQLDRKIQQVLNQIEQTSNIFSTSSSFQTPPETPTRPRNSKPPPSLETLLSQELKSLVKLYQTYTIRLSTLLPLSALPQALQMPQGSASTSNPSVSPSSSPLIPTRLGSKRTNNHQATASLSELHRHASLAILERKEIQQWESSSSSFSPSSPSTSFSPTTKPRPSSVYSSISSSDSTTTLLNQSIASSEQDPFHPTETFFGGLERKSSTRSNPSYLTSSSLTSSSSSNERGHHQHRFRPSIGNQGVFGIGTSAASGGGGGVSPLLREISSKRDSRKRRPVSMGGWIESTSSRSSVPLIPLSPTVVVVTEGSSSNSRMEEDQKRRGVEGNREGEWEVDEKIIEGLRKDWENSHLFRKGFIWNLIALFEEVGQEEEGEKVTRNNKWEETRKVLKELVSKLQGVLERVDLVRLEVQTNQTTILDRQRPQRQDHHSPRLSSSSIVVTPFSPSPSPLPHLLRLSSPPSTASNSFTSSSFSRPLVQPNFAPPRDSSSLPTIQALNSYQLSHNSLSNSLGSMQSLLDSIVSELRTLSPTSPPPPPPTLASTTTGDEESEQHRRQLHRQGRIEGLLKRHDQIKEELQSFAIEWSKSRVSIRQAVGVELKTSLVEQQQRQQSSTKVGEREGEGIEKEEKTELNPQDAPPEQEEEEELENALLDDGQSTTIDDEFSSRQAVVDAILSTSLGLGNGLGIDTEGGGGEEKIFEAVVGGEEKEKRGQGDKKLSREERVRRMKEAREALNVGKQATGEGGIGGGFEAQQKMVGELREVLKGLGKGRD
ncbi:hypothetical protein JCM5350_005946 [Sporobolomyces pararoseus]